MRHSSIWCLSPLQSEGGYGISRAQMNNRPTRPKNSKIYILQKLILLIFGFGFIIYIIFYVLFEHHPPSPFPELCVRKNEGRFVSLKSENEGKRIVRSGRIGRVYFQSSLSRESETSSAKSICHADHARVHRRMDTRTRTVTYRWNNSSSSAEYKGNIYIP